MWIPFKGMKCSVWQRDIVVQPVPIGAVAIDRRELDWVCIMVTRTSGNIFTQLDRRLCVYRTFMESREVMTYEDFGRATRVLAQRIYDSEFAPDIVLSIARGGFFLGAGLGYALGVKNAFMMSVEYYTGIDERLAMPIVLPPVPNKVDLSGAVVLVADDVADSGHTLKMVMDFCAGSVREVRSAVLYAKPQSVIVPDYSWKKTDKWINFPWSVDGPVISSESSAH